VNGKQQVVAVGGAGLILVNFWLTGSRQTVSAGIFNNNATDAQTSAAHTELKKFGAELLFVGVATLLAGLSNNAGTAMVAIIAALFIVWAMNRYATKG
jgi:hypothetical protein